MSRLEEARAAWEKLLEPDPPDHDSWYGYAELCLFLGREDDYRRVRRALLKRFGATTNPFARSESPGRVCSCPERTTNCVRPWPSPSAPSPNERVTSGRRPYFEFVHGLAEYRRGQFDRAIATMQGEASGVLGPAPRLVLAPRNTRKPPKPGYKEDVSSLVSPAGPRRKAKTFCEECERDSVRLPCVLQCVLRLRWPDSFLGLGRSCDPGQHWWRHPYDSAANIIHWPLKSKSF